MAHTKHTRRGGGKGKSAVTFPARGGGGREGEEVDMEGVDLGGCDVLREMKMICQTQL